VTDSAGCSPSESTVSCRRDNMDKIKVMCNTDFVAVWEHLNYGGSKGKVLEVPKGLAKDLTKAGYVSPVKRNVKKKSSPAKVQPSEE
jgi:hypothetical protein